VTVAVLKRRPAAIDPQPARRRWRLFSTNRTRNATIGHQILFSHLLLLFSLSVFLREKKEKKMEEVSVQQVDRLLKTWSQNILDQTKEIIASSLGKYPDTVNGANSLAILDDVKDRQSRVITVRGPLSLGSPRWLSY
jgi:hypothetical protein